MNKELYSGKESIDERLKKFSHYRQKGSVSEHTFLERS